MKNIEFECQSTLGNLCDLFSAAQIVLIGTDQKSTVLIPFLILFSLRISSEVMSTHKFDSFGLSRSVFFDSILSPYVTAVESERECENNLQRMKTKIDGMERKDNRESMVTCKNAIDWMRASFIDAIRAHIRFFFSCVWALKSLPRTVYQ